jgi:DNA-binding IclR family transcriptional regulator
MRALERVIAILEAVAESQPSATTGAVAEKTELAVSTVSRLAREMVNEGLLDRDGADGSYVLGSRLVAIARSALEPQDLVQAALPVMESLRDISGETVALHVRRLSTRICILQVQSEHAVRRVVPVGLTVPLQHGATGAALLAGLRQEELDGYLQDAGIVGHELEVIRERVSFARREGYALAADAWIEGVAGVASGVFAGERIVASLSVSGPSTRWTTDAMRAFGPELSAAAETISKRLTS